MNAPFLAPAAVTGILLQYNTHEDTLACLDALEAMPDMARRCIVVDNGSGGAAGHALLRQPRKHGFDSAASPSGAFPAPASPCIFLPLDRNNGYAAGNNAGIRLALEDPACKAVWILNNDTFPQPGALQALCRCLNENPGAGMAGSTLVYAHAPDRVQCAGGYRLNPLLGATAPLCGGLPLAEVLRLEPQRIADRLGYISGASLLVRREVLEDIGLLAEEYFLYYEDAEFGLRARRHGYGLAWARDSVVPHKEGGSSGASSGSPGRGFSRSALVDYLSLRNRVSLMRRYYPLALPLVAASYAGVMLKRVLRGQAKRIPLVCRALWDGLRGNMGKPLFLTRDAPSGRPPKTALLFITARADFGGGPEHLYQLLRTMPEDFTACVACPEDYPYYERFCRLAGTENVFAIPHRGFSPRKLWKLKKFMARRGVRLVHSHGKGAGLYGRLLAPLSGRPCVHTFHGVHMDAYGPVKKQAYRLYERCMSFFTRAAIAVSAGEQERILAERLMPRKKLHVIPNGVAVPGKSIPASLAAPYRVISLSRFDYAKNSEFVLEILEALRKRGKLEQFRIRIIGDGPGKAALEEEARARGLFGSLRLAGADPAPWANISDALCCLSTSRWEGMPLALLEGMAHGLPAVASHVTGNRDVIEEGRNGLLYPPGDAEAAAEALCRLAERPEQRERMALRARERVQEKHTVELMAEKTFALLRGMLA